MLTHLRHHLATFLDAVADRLDPRPTYPAYEDLRPISVFKLGLAAPSLVRLTDRGKAVCDLAHKLDLDVALCMDDRRAPLFLIAHTDLPADNRIIVCTNLDRLRPE